MMRAVAVVEPKCVLVRHHTQDWQKRGRALLLACLSGWPAALAAQVANPFAKETISGWRLAVGMAESWDSNLQFNSTNGAASSITRIRGEGARLWQGSRDRSVVSVGVGLVQYGQQSQLNQYAYVFGASTSHQFARRISSELTLNASSDLTNRSVSSSGSGALLAGLYQVRSTRTVAAVRYQVSRRIGFSVSARQQSVRISALPDGDGRSESASAELSGRASKATLFGFLAEYQRSAIGVTSIRLPRISLRVDQQLSPLLSLSVVGGGVWATNSSSSSNLNGSGTLTYRDRTTSVSIDARRSVGQEFGQLSANAFVSDNLGLSCARTFARTLQLQARAGAGWTRTGSTALGNIRSSEASIDLRYASRSKVILNFGAFLYQRSDQRTIVSHGVNAGVAYSWSQLRVAS